MSRVTLQDSDPRDYRRRQPLDGASEWGRALEERPLRFAYLDGTIDAVCPGAEEDWVLNVKRGILSSLQNTMVTLDGDARGHEVVCVLAKKSILLPTEGEPLCTL